MEEKENTVDRILCQIKNRRPFPPPPPLHPSLILVRIHKGGYNLIQGLYNLSLAHACVHYWRSSIKFRA